MDKLLECFVVATPIIALFGWLCAVWASIDELERRVADLEKRERFN